MRGNLRGESRLIGAAMIVLLVAFAAGLLLTSQVMDVKAHPAGQGGFATVTPVPPDPLDGARTGFINQYAMRLWQESDMIEVFISQLERLVAGEDVPAVALQLTQYELNTRFPDAPLNADLRERVLELMLAAPRGSVDMRDYMRPFIVDQVNAGSTGATGRTALDNFTVQTVFADYNGDELSDAYLHVRFPADDTVDALYEDFILVLGTESGLFFLPSISGAWPAAPFDGIEALEMLRTGDLNGDGLDELALRVDRGGINHEIVIAGWRNGAFITLVQPNTPLRYTEILDWPENSTALLVTTNQVESARWGCLSQIEQPWEYRSNFFRPVQTFAATSNTLDGPGCELLAAEPLFEQPMQDALDTVLGALARADDPTTDDYARAGMALALLYRMNGQDDRATQQIDLMRPFAENNVWLTEQIDAFTTATATDGVTPVEICAQLTLRDETAACSVDQLLSRLFDEDPISREGDLIEELESRGLTVLDQVNINEVGRLPRQVVNFNLTGASWWAFVASDPDFYVPELATAPAGFDDVFFPSGLTEVSQSIYGTLLVDDDLGAALVALNNIRADADAPLSASARYLQALLLDLLGNRQDAKQVYYDLWGDFPNSHWGQLAGAHLEPR